MAPRPRRTSSAWPTCTARSAPALSHKGERKAAIEHYQKGINLLKDGPPRLELVRLYEEAAWLYLHTGDNMLAIYASEKALRLAERLGETRAASRAHGIFGRVFGRIGDTEKARQNLERAVELARGSDHGETILALSALGRHLEVSEADVAGARAAYEEALALAEQMGVLPAQVELHASLAQLAVYSADWEQVERSTEASAELAEREGLVGKLCLPYALRGLLRWREGRHRRGHRALPPRARAGRAGGLVGARLPGAVRPGHGAARLAATWPGASAALDRALDVCERAGLIAQSIQATAARAVVLALAHRREAAAEAAREAAELAERLHYPIGRAAALEARGVCADDPREGAELLAEAAAAWTALDRPLEAARSRLLAGQTLVGGDPGRGARAARGGGRGDRAPRRAAPLRAARAGRVIDPAEARYGRLVGAGDHDHGGVAGQLLARRVDGLALGDAEPAAHGGGLALVARRRTGPPTRRAAGSAGSWRRCRRVKPAASTWSLSVAARPGTVVPLSTATVTLAGRPRRRCFLGSSLAAPRRRRRRAARSASCRRPWAGASAAVVAELSWVTPKAAAPPTMSTPAIASTR